MCQRVNCRTCQKPTWSGCGAHVEQVLHDVPAVQRCACVAPPKQSFTQRFRRGV